MLPTAICPDQFTGVFLMTNYQIITDSGCDLPNDLLEKLDVKKAHN